MWAPHHSCFVSVRVCIHLHMYMYMPCVCFRAYYAQVKCTYALLVAVREAKVRWTCDNGTVDVGTQIEAGRSLEPLQLKIIFDMLQAGYVFLKKHVRPVHSK